MERIEIDKDKPLNPGDVIELHYKTTGLAWIKAAQIAMIEQRLMGQPKFDIISSQYDKNNLIFTCRIIAPRKQPGQVQEAGVISAAAIAKVILVVAVGLMFWLSLDKVYQIVDTVADSPTGKVLVGGLGSMALAAGIGGLLLLFGGEK